MTKKPKDMTTEERKAIKVEFAPGAFDHFDGTQEELDELLANIYAAIETGELFEESRELTDEEFDELPDEIKLQIIDSFDDENKGRTLQ